MELIRAKGTNLKNTLMKGFLQDMEAMY